MAEKTKIEITPEMLEAGIRVYQEFQGWSVAAHVRAIFEEMIRCLPNSALRTSTARVFEDARAQAMQVCTAWLDDYTGERIEHTDAATFAADAVRDIRDAIGRLQEK